MAEFSGYRWTKGGLTVCTAPYWVAAVKLNGPTPNVNNGCSHIQDKLAMKDGI